jgi:hypothetical protein
MQAERSRKMMWSMVTKAAGKIKKRETGEVLVNHGFDNVRQYSSLFSRQFNVGLINTQMIGAWLQLVI